MDTCFLEKRVQPKRKIIRYKSLKRNTLNLISKNILYKSDYKGVMSPRDENPLPVKPCILKDCGCQYGSYCGSCTPRFY